MKESEIYFNIWDDFWDDGHAPAGEIQETHGYIESDESEEEQRAICTIVYNFLMELEFPEETEIKLCDEQIQFKNLTHVRLDKLMDELKNSGLNYKDKLIYFYSES